MEAQPCALIESFSNDDGDGKEDVKKAVGLLEIRVSQNLAKLGGGGAHKGWEDRREMK